MGSIEHQNITENIEHQNIKTFQYGGIHLQLIIVAAVIIIYTIILLLTLITSAYKQPQCIVKRSVAFFPFSSFPSLRFLLILQPFFNSSITSSPFFLFPPLQYPLTLNILNRFPFSCLLSKPKHSFPSIVNSIQIEKPYPKTNTDLQPWATSPPIRRTWITAARKAAPMAPFKSAIIGSKSTKPLSFEDVFSFSKIPRNRSSSGMIFCYFELFLMLSNLICQYCP